MIALRHDRCYQRQIAPAYDKKVKPRIFQDGGLFFKKILPFREDPRPNYEGPYVLLEVLLGGAL